MKNPAKTQPFPSHFPGAHNPSLSFDDETSEEESDFGGESVPIGPCESTREWLERTGMHATKIAPRAHVIAAR